MKPCFVVPMLTCLALDGCAARDPVALASSSAGWGASPPAALANLQKAYPTLDLKWSPTIHEPGVGDYHAVFFDNAQLRAYVDSADRVTALSVSQDDPADLAAAGREATRFVDAVAPAVPESQRLDTAAALANLVQGGQKASVTLAGIEFKVSTGLVHYSIRAKPV